MDPKKGEDIKKNERAYKNDGVVYLFFGNEH